MLSMMFKTNSSLSSPVGPAMMMARSSRAIDSRQTPTEGVGELEKSASDLKRQTSVYNLLQHLRGGPFESFW
jgi:hypothetical protein